MSIVRDFEMAFNRQDVTALVACFTPTGRYRDTFFGEHIGHAALRAMFERMFHEGRDYAWTMEHVIEDDRRAAAEWTFSYVVSNAVPQDAREWRPAPREWSAHEVVCHCADSETNGYARIRYLLAETDPVIQGYDQEEWARRFDYHGQPLEPALAVVEAVRANTVALLRRLPEAAWVREGRHTESGRYTAEDWLAIYADHLEGHARQIETNVELWQAAQRR